MLLFLTTSNLHLSSVKTVSKAIHNTRYSLTAKLHCWKLQALAGQLFRCPVNCFIFHILLLTVHLSRPMVHFGCPLFESQQKFCLQPVVHLKIWKYGTRILRWKGIGTPSVDHPPVNTTFLQTRSKTYIANITI